MCPCAQCPIGGMVVLEGSPTMSEPEHFDKVTWYRRDKVVELLDCSPAKITRLQDKKKLHAVVVEGINYYDPAEVHSVASELQKEKDQLLTPQGRREVTEAYMLETTRAIVALIRDPREKIDDIQFKIIERMSARIEELEKKLDAARQAVEEAKDSTLERNLAIKQVESEGRIKELALGRMVETVGKLITGMGKPGVALTPEQLEELLIANKEEPFLTDDQAKQAAQIVAQHKAKTNGESAVETMAKTVVEATGAAAK